MNGKTLAADNEQRLGELRAFFELMKGVDPVRTRAILLAPGGDGRTVYSLVASGEIAKAITAIQRASRTIVVARTRRESDAPSPLAYLDHRDMEIASRPQGAKGQRLNLGKAKPKA